MNTFAAHTRSTAFSLTLSQKMVNHLLRYEVMVQADAVMEDLASRFDWYKPHDPRTLYAHFVREGDLEQIYLDATTRALVKRGLLEVETGVTSTEIEPLFKGDEPEIQETPWCTVKPTPAGLKMIELLQIAEFEAPCPISTYIKAVDKHPDDRLRILWRKDTPKAERVQPTDRRINLMLPGDLQWMPDLKALIENKQKIEELLDG